MKQKKKLLAAVFCACMTASVLSSAACAKTASAAKPSAAVTAAETASAVTKDETGPPARKPDTASTAGKTGKAGKKADGTGKNARKDFLSELVSSGSLSETTYEKIMTYLQEHQPEKPDGSRDDGISDRPPDRPDDARDNGVGDVPPDRPDDASGEVQKGERSGRGMRGRGGMMLGEETLQAMLEEGIITESELTVIREALPQKPEKDPAN